MATVDAKKLTNLAFVSNDKIAAKVLAGRQQVLALSTFNGLQIGTGITSWEELGCVGYNPELSLLEATVTIKRSSGYSGGLCAAGSTEYVRFFVDYEDGAGFQDAGIGTVQVHDIPDDDPGPQHPLRYLVQLPLDADPHRKLCRTAVLPKVRAILSWNTPPSTDPNATPVFGNRVDTRVQLKPRLGFLPIDAVNAGVLDANIGATLGPATFLKFKPVQPDFLSKAQMYTEARAEHRLAFAASQPQTLAALKPLAPTNVTFNEGLLKALKIDLSKLIAALNDKANVDYEELTCVGLNPARDTLGAIVRVKKAVGYSGSLCELGSQEHVAFWADWNNNGSFDYLGTASVEVHDVPHTDAIDYAVQLPTPKILQHLKKCANVNVIRIRAVLSWSSLPSTTDPWDLNTWGNRVDVLVQLRPGQSGGLGITHLLYDIGNVTMENIDPATHLAYPGTPGPSTYRPWGGAIRIGGRIYGTGTPGSVHYRLRVRKSGTSAWTTLVNPFTIELMHPLPSDPLYPKEFVTVNADANGWRPYLENPTAPFPILERTALLGWWNTGAAEQGTYDIQLQYTDSNVASGPIVITGEQTVTIEVNNKDFTTSPNWGTSIDTAYDVDIVIQGGDCKLYPHGTDLSGTPLRLDGRVKVIHPYFSQYTLDLQPSTHVNAAQTRINGVVTTVRACTALSDHGDDGSGGVTGLWSIVNAATIDPCGYTVLLRAWDRTIRNSNGGSTFFTSKAVGFAIF
ncbi:MAG TPA: hypothetical protein VF824_19565 [Thermoanaerobaculia bacterium]|jgi:hypothetical protein